MRRLHLVLGDQLTPELSALRDVDPATDLVLMAEVMAEASYVPHHPQKLTLIFSAMRHFAEELRQRGLRVDYVRLDDPANRGSFDGELSRAVLRHRPQRLVATHPGEWRVLEMMRRWPEVLGVPLDLREDDRYFAAPAHFAQWAQGRKEWRMEYFYRQLRRETGLLMVEGEPAGGQWNLDAENRKPLPRGWSPPERLRFEPDAVTREVMQLVRTRFAHHFGALEPFGWAVTRADAQKALEAFIEEALPQFGDYQDAMSARSPYLCHSLLAPYLNLGLLTAAEVCRRAEQAWRAGAAPLNAVEGFIRQILGWREFVRGLYWHCMPEYPRSNVLQAARPLPALYWGAGTDMRCLSQVVEQTRQHAYSHHIQRLMVTGNFALLAGLKPKEVEDWYLAVYADAFEWVELPNTHGMALYADGGLMASKPYAAAAAYMRRMSDYCQGCRFDPRLRTGPRACPFNALYWNFLIRHEGVLRSNPRMAMPYRNLDGWDQSSRQAITRAAEDFLERL